MQREGAAGPLAAITILQDVVPSGDHDALVLTPKGEPTISVTYLSDDNGPGADLIAAAAKDQLGKLLKPFRIPVPKFALDKLGAGFAGQSLAIDSPNVSIDKKSGRLGASGVMMITK
jgi:hypothetical protein